MENTIQAISIPTVIIIGAIITIIGTIIMGLIGTISAVAWWSFNRWVSNSDKEKAEAKAEKIQRDADLKAERIRIETDQKSEREAIAASLRADREVLNLQMQQNREALLLQMKLDREQIAQKQDQDKHTFDDRVTKAAELFGAQVKQVGTEFMSEMKEVKSTINNLSMTISNLVTGMGASEKRMDQLHIRIEEVSKRGHDTDQVVQALNGKIAVNSQRFEDRDRQTELIRDGGFKRLDTVERIMHNLLGKKTAIPFDPDDDDDEVELPRRTNSQNKIKKKSKR